MPKIIALDAAGSRPLSQVGGKAAALARLIEWGAPVPPGFVVPPGLNLPEAKVLLLAAFDLVGAPLVAVRSSAAGEDAKAHSWAGQFESYLCVTRDQLISRILACRKSGQSTRVQAYDAQGQSMPMAVIVQAMIPSDVAGVLFTANPVTHNCEEIIVEAVFGLGELLVQGIATPDNYVVAKGTGAMLKQSIVQKTAMLVGSAQGVVERPVPISRQGQPALTAAQCRELAKLASSLEASFGYPLDLEFAYHNGRPYIVQARPITTM